MTQNWKYIWFHKSSLIMHASLFIFFKCKISLRWCEHVQSIFSTVLSQYKKYIGNFNNSSGTISFEDKILIYLTDCCGFITVVNYVLRKENKHNLLEKKHLSASMPHTVLLSEYSCTSELNHVVLDVCSEFPIIKRKHPTSIVN